MGGKDGARKKIMREVNLYCSMGSSEVPIRSMHESELSCFHRSLSRLLNLFTPVSGGDKCMRKLGSLTTYRYAVWSVINSIQWFRG